MASSSAWIWDKLFFIIFCNAASAAICSAWMDKNEDIGDTGDIECDMVEPGWGLAFMLIVLWGKDKDWDGEDDMIFFDDIDGETACQGDLNIFQKKIKFNKIIK